MEIRVKHRVCMFASSVSQVCQDDGQSLGNGLFEYTP